MKQIIKLTLPILILGVIFNTSIFAYSQNDEQINEEVKGLNNEIQNKKDELKTIQEQQDRYAETIKNKQKEQASLNNQLSILDNRLAKAALDIESTQIEIDQINLEIKKVNLEIEENNVAIENLKSHIGSVLRAIYKQNKTNSLEMVLLNDSLGDFLNQMKYLEDINEEITDSLTNLENLKSKLDKNKLSLDEKNKELNNLKEELLDFKLALEGEKNSKEIIVTQVKSSEKEYQRLLALAKEEQERAASDIASLEQTVRTKIANLQGKELEFNDNGLIWPVPKNTITSYFHDPEYPFRYIFEHPAIDIRAGQGTTLKAAASGYVARAKDSGKGYSYIMIIHGDGLSTVYGHVSKIYVEEDEYVVQGQAIGLSGGMPGSSGAGSLTTGPHLHFEVRLNGIPVNPLEYLP
ncbi:MAG: peptidoglycan DD-metalloendopeptidase family protein [Patescibacteria group bacterium]